MMAEWPPRVAQHAITLPRVVDVLNGWAPITFVHGMRGYGKTTQVACWLRDLRPCPPLLWLDSAEMNARSTLSAWIARRLSAPGTTPLAAREVIVIDDAHLLLDDDSARRVVDLVLHRHQVHVVAISPAGLQLQSLADGRVPTTRVPGGDLLFRPHETAALACDLGVPLTGEQVTRLHTAFGGWPAAVRMVLDEMRAGADHLPITRAERYLRRTVLPDLVESMTVRVSMRFALAERLTHRLIHDLAEGTTAHEIIGILEGLGCTDIRHLVDDVHLVLPAFVRRTLRDHYMAAEPDAARGMHRRLAAWYASRRGPDHDLHAIQHAKAAEDWSQFEASWIMAGASLAMSRPSEVEFLLRDLPAAVINRHPSIAVLRAALAAGRYRGESSTAQCATVRAEFARMSGNVAPSLLTRMPASDLLLIGAGQLAELRRTDQADQLDVVASRITAAWSRRRRRGESGGDSLSWFYLQRGITDHLRVRYAEASRWYRLCWQHRRASIVGAGGIAAAGLALIEAVSGRHDDAENWMRQYRNLTPGPALPSECAGAMVAVASQLASVDRLDSNPSKLTANITQAAAASDFWAHAAFAQARWNVIFGRPATGIGALARVREIHRDDRSCAAAILLARAHAELFLATGQGHRAMTMLRSADVESEPMLAVPLGWLYLLTADPAAARSVAVRALVQDTTVTSDRVELLVVSAIAALRLDNVVEARDVFGEAVSVAADSGVVRPFALPRREVLRSLQDSLDLTLPAEIRRRVASVPPAYPEAISLVRLTRREQQIATRLQRGLSRDQIAEQLFVSINTVKKQLATLYRKLGVSSRTDALARLAGLGLLISDDRPASMRNLGASPAPELSPRE